MIFSAPLSCSRQLSASAHPMNAGEPLATGNRPCFLPFHMHIAGIRRSRLVAVRACGVGSPPRNAIKRAQLVSVRGTRRGHATTESSGFCDQQGALNCCQKLAQNHARSGAAYPL
jgi:hypothetical protein